MTDKEFWSKGFYERKVCIVDYDNIERALEKELGQPHINSMFHGGYEGSPRLHEGVLYGFQNDVILSVGDIDPYEDFDNMPEDAWGFLEEYLTGENDYMDEPPIRVFLCILCTQGLIPSGEYFVEVYW